MADLIPLSWLHTVSESRPYVGASYGISSLDPNQTGRTGPQYTVQNNRSVGNVYAGLENGAWAVEIGGGPLADRRSHNVSSTYDIKQNISADHIYLAALRKFRLMDKLSAHAKLGVARVMFKNHEFGSNENGPNQTQLNYGTDTVPIYGAGLEAVINKNLSLRLEAERLDRLIKSHWTRPHSDISKVSAGLKYKF